MRTENIKCDICKKIVWAFIDVDTEKNFFMSKRFKVCVKCFKEKDIDEIIGKEMNKQATDLIEHHQNKIDEIKLRLKGS